MQKTVTYELTEEDVKYAIARHLRDTLDFENYYFEADDVVLEAKVRGDNSWQIEASITIEEEI